MKAVKNTIAKVSQTETQTYGELILLCIKQPSIINNQPQGLDYETLKKIRKVDDLIGTDNVSKEFIFEDADFDFVQSKVKGMVWGVYNTALVDFVTYIVELK